MRIGNLEVDLKKLADFLVIAKKNGYAGRKEKLRQIDGSKTFTFQHGHFHYTDNYAGSYQAPGTEIVRWERAGGQRIWQMSYSGGMHKEHWRNDALAEETYDFLKDALMLVTPELPFRGPVRYANGDLKYVLEINGDIQRFSGVEIISSEKLNDVVFSQDVIGGLVIYLDKK